VGLTTLPSLCADCLEILGTSTCWSPVQACNVIAFHTSVQYILQAVPGNVILVLNQQYVGYLT